MGAVLLLVRSEFRRRWRSLALLALVVTFAGGATLAAAAGARRTSTSFVRFRASTRSHNVLVFAQDVGRADIDKLRSLPGIDAVGWARQLALVRPDGDFLAVGGPLDDSLFHDVYRYRIVEGRAPRYGAADEVVVSEPLAGSAHIRPGDILPVRAYTPEQVGKIGPSTAELPAPAGPAVRLRVVGINRAPIDLSLQGSAGGILLLPRAFVEQYGNRIGNFSGPRGAVLFVRLTDGDAGVQRFVGQLRSQLGARPFELDPSALSVGGVQDSIDLLALSVVGFGALAGIAGLIALALIISRQVALFASGQAAVRELGLSSGYRALASAGPVFVAVATGTVGAVIGAWIVSPLMPFGVAGRAEPDPGLHFDAAALVLGAAAILALLGAVTALASWRAVRIAPSGARMTLRRSILGRRLEAAGLAPAATIGVGLALDPGRGRNAVPVRSALVGVTVAVLGVGAVLVFGTSLDRLASTPTDYGINWDLRVADTQARFAHDGQRCGAAETRLVSQPTVDAVANACSLSITLNGRAVGGVGLTSLRGLVQPTVLEGRAPVAADEVALGSLTLDALHLRIGDLATAPSASGDVTFRIVGRVVVPALADPQAVADGAVFTGDGLARLDDPGNVSGASTLLVRLRPGIDRTRAEQDIAHLPGLGGTGTPPVARTAVPLDVERLQEINRIPLALAAFLTTLGALAVGYLLVSSVQRRRRDFAVLKALGFCRSQVYATVWTQSTTVAVVGLIPGLVAGVVLGGGLWRATAERVGLPLHVDFPILALAAVALAALLIANLVAVIPAQTAARTHAATLLRTE